MKESRYRFLEPVNYEILSSLSFRKVVGREKTALLQLLVTAQKEVLLFLLEHDGERHAAPPERIVATAYNPEKNQLLLSCAAGLSFEQDILEAGVILIVELDEGMLQLEIEPASLDRVPDGLLCLLPHELLLIQRRQARRVEILEHLQFYSPTLAALGAERVSVEDISDLGIGLIIEGALSLEKGMMLDSCQLTLPGLDRIELQVEVKGCSVKKEGSGGEITQLGGIFVGLEASYRALIQRYTFQQELQARKRDQALENLKQSQVVAGEPVMKARY